MSAYVIRREKDNTEQDLCRLANNPLFHDTLLHPLKVVNSAILAACVAPINNYGPVLDFDHFTYHVERSPADPSHVSALFNKLKSAPYRMKTDCWSTNTWAPHNNQELRVVDAFTSLGYLTPPQFLYDFCRSLVVCNSSIVSKLLIPRPNAFHWSLIVKLLTHKESYRYVSIVPVMSLLAHNHVFQLLRNALLRLRSRAEDLLLVESQSAKWTRLLRGSRASCGSRPNGALGDCASCVRGHCPCGKTKLVP